MNCSLNTRRKNQEKTRKEHQKKKKISCLGFFLEAPIVVFCCSGVSFCLVFSFGVSLFCCFLLWTSFLLKKNISSYERSGVQQHLLSSVVFCSGVFKTSGVQQQNIFSFKEEHQLFCSILFTAEHLSEHQLFCSLLKDLVFWFFLKKTPEHQNNKTSFRKTFFYQVYKRSSTKKTHIIKKFLFSFSIFFFFLKEHKQRC